MVAARTGLLTAADLWRMPGDEPWELWEGELQEVPSAGGRASRVAGEFYALLWQFVAPGNLGLLTTTDGSYVVLHDPDTVLVPDVAFVRWDRLPGGVEPEGYVPVPPALVIEVRSPTDRPVTIAKKLDLYRRAGVKLVWWADPERQTVQVFRDGVLVATLGIGDELDGEDVLPGFRLPLAQIFRRAGA